MFILGLELGLGLVVWYYMGLTSRQRQTDRSVK